VPESSSAVPESSSAVPESSSAVPESFNVILSHSAVTFYLAVWSLTVNPGGQKQ